MIKVTSREDFLIELQNLLIPSPCVVEIGVFRGQFAKMMLDILNPSALVLIDPFEENNEWYGEEGVSIRTAYSTNADYELVKKKFNKYLNTTIDRGYSYNVVSNYKNGMFDLVYIDASHLKDDVKRDLNDWMPKVSINGIIGGHDYEGTNGFGVIEAVDEFMEEQGYEMILINEMGGDFALKKKQ